MRPSRKLSLKWSSGSEPAPESSGTLSWQKQGTHVATPCDAVGCRVRDLPGLPSLNQSFIPLKPNCFLKYKLQSSFCSALIRPAKSNCTISAWSWKSGYNPCLCWGGQVELLSKEHEYPQDYSRSCQPQLEAQCHLVDKRENAPSVACTPLPPPPISGASLK